MSSSDKAHDRDEVREREQERGVDRADHDPEGARKLHNPPHTTTGKVTAPKFGSAVSGGGDIEPAPGS